MTTRFAEDREHASYDASSAHRFWRALRSIEPVFQTLSRALPRQVQPGAVLLGRLRPRGDTLQRAARSPAQGHGRSRRVRRGGISLGFWPGDAWKGASRGDVLLVHRARAGGTSRRARAPGRSVFSDTFKELVLPYEDVRRAADPAVAILEFAESTYEAGATLAGWDKVGLEYRAR